jgi:hypothetical protein
MGLWLAGVGRIAQPPSCTPALRRLTRVLSAPHSQHPYLNTWLSELLTTEPCPKGPCSAKSAAPDILPIVLTDPSLADNMRFSSLFLTSLALVYPAALAAPYTLGKCTTSVNGEKQTVSCPHPLRDGDDSDLSKVCSKFLNVGYTRKKAQPSGSYTLKKSPLYISQALPVALC